MQATSRATCARLRFLSIARASKVALPTTEHHGSTLISVMATARPASLSSSRTGWACARCDLYVPKNSTRVQLLEARGNLQRMLAQIPLTDDERAAVEDGTAAVERLLDQLRDAPTPAGPTPRELATASSYVPLTQLNAPNQPNTGQHVSTGSLVENSVEKS